MKFFLPFLLILAVLTPNGRASIEFAQHYPQPMDDRIRPFIYGLNAAAQLPPSNDVIVPYTGGNFVREGPIPGPDVFNSIATSKNPMCDRWKFERSNPRKDTPVEVVALAVFHAVEPSACADSTSRLCKIIQTVKHAAGGDLDPRRGYPSTLSEKDPLNSLPLEKRVTATIVLDPSSQKIGSLSSLFEAYLVASDRTETTPRIHNAIRVNNRKEELSISAGSGYDQMYAFSHSNEATNSIWIILYLGPTRSIEFGRKVLEGFRTYLGQVQNFQIADYSIVSSQDEFADEKKAEKATEEAITRNSFGTASFALDLMCPQ